MYLNSRKVEKLLFVKWLISATMFYFSHLETEKERPYFNAGCEGFGNSPTAEAVGDGAERAS